MKGDNHLGDPTLIYCVVYNTPVILLTNYRLAYNPAVKLPTFTEIYRVVYNPPVIVPTTTTWYAIQRLKY